MAAFTLEDLLRIVNAATGEPLTTTAPENVRDTPFEELGLDSLALLETATRVERETGVTLHEEAIAALDTPRRFVDYVNTRGADPR